MLFIERFRNKHFKANSIHYMIAPDPVSTQPMHVPSVKNNYLFLYYSASALLRSQHVGQVRLSERKSFLNTFGS